MVVRVNRYGAGERAGCAESVRWCSPAVGCRQAAGRREAERRQWAGARVSRRVPGGWGGSVAGAVAEVRKGAVRSPTFRLANSPTCRFVGKLAGRSGCAGARAGRAICGGGWRDERCTAAGWRKKWVLVDARVVLGRLAGRGAAGRRRPGRGARGCAGAAGRRRMRRQAGLVVYLGVSRGGGPDKPASGEMGQVRCGPAGAAGGWGWFTRRVRRRGDGCSGAGWSG